MDLSKTNRPLTMLSPGLTNSSVAKQLGSIVVFQSPEIAAGFQATVRVARSSLTLSRPNTKSPCWRLAAPRQQPLVESTAICDLESLVGYYRLLQRRQVELYIVLPSSQIM
jgi:hypothetical protein